MRPLRVSSGRWVLVIGTWYESAHYPVPAVPARVAPVAGSAVRRHILEVGAECVSSARSDLCGGRSVMSVPTAIETLALRAVPVAAGVVGDAGLATSVALLDMTAE